MRAATLLGVVLLAAVTIAAQGTEKPRESAQGSGAGSAAVKQVADNYVKAVLAGSASAVADLYTDDAMEMPPNQPLLKGKAAIQQYYEKVFSGGMKVTAFTLNHLESRASADTAWDVGTYNQSMQGETGTTGRNSDSGKYVVILKRTGGAWKVAYAIYNSDQPPVPGR